jgi:hypothetical protein
MTPWTWTLTLEYSANLVFLIVTFFVLEIAEELEGA